MNRFSYIVFLIFLGIISRAQIHVGNDDTICFGETVYLDAIVDIPSTYNQVFFVDDDSVYNEVLDIGFTFKFYEYTVSQFVIAPNGWISFDTDLAGTYDDWHINSIPNTDPAVPKNAIMAPWQDWVPFVYNGSYVGYETVGDPPYRQLVVSWFNVPLNNTQEDSLGVFQIILNETTNTIENHITKKPDTPWQDGIATQGVHNQNGTLAVTIPERNMQQWTTSYDAWKYEPSGPPQFYDIEPIEHNPVISGVLSDVFWYKNAYDPDSLIFTGSIFPVTPTQTTSYLAVVLLNDIVPFIDTITITVNPLPIANAGGDQVILQGTFTFLDGSATGGNGLYFYSWEPVNMVIDPTNPTTETVTLWSTQLYTLFVYDDLGCESTGSDVVIAVENDPLFAYITVDEPIVCSGDTVTLEVHAYGGDISQNYTYEWTSDPPGLIVFTPVAVATPIQTTTYFVRVDCGNESYTDSVIITVPVVNPAIIGDTTVCAFETGVLYTTDSTGNYFNWSISGLVPQGTNQINNQFSINWGDVGVGQLKVIETTADIYQCSDSAYINIAVFPNPVPLIYSLDDSVCEGTDVVYFPTNITENEYEWDFSPSTIGTSDNYDSTVFNVHWIGDGTAYVSLTETSAVGCTSSDLFEVVINPLPEPSISGGLDVCEDDTLLYLTDFIIGNEYEWELFPPTIGEIITSLDSNEIAIYWKDSGTASLYVTETVTTTSCEKISDTITININPSPVFSAFPGNGAICFGDSTMVTLTGTDLYTWIPDTGLYPVNDSSWLLMPSQTTAYKIIGTNAGSGCSDSIFYSLEVKPNPVVDLGDDRFLWADASLFLNAGNGFDYYFWSTGDVDSVLQVFNPGDYWVEVGLNGCYAIDSLFVTLPLQRIPIPNAFTPNQDGINDVFNIVSKNYNLININDFSLQIFNRWGQLIFETNDPTLGWDGTCKNELCKQGTYVYIISYVEMKSEFPVSNLKRGTVTLLR